MTQGLEGPMTSTRKINKKESKISYNAYVKMFIRINKKISKIDFVYFIICFHQFNVIFLKMFKTKGFELLPHIKFF